MSLSQLLNNFLNFWEFEPQLLINSILIRKNECMTKLPPPRQKWKSICSWAIFCASLGCWNIECCNHCRFDFRHGLYMVTSLLTNWAPLNRDKIESSLSVPGIQERHENALIKSFEMSPHLIVYQDPFRASLKVREELLYM